MNDTVRQLPVHVVDAGDTLEAIAAQYGVTPRALRLANPELFPVLPTTGGTEAATESTALTEGGQIVIPATPMSVTEGSIRSEVNPIYASSGSEYALEADAGGVEGRLAWNPSEGAIEATGSVEVSSDAISESPVTYSARQETARSSWERSENGFTTFGVGVDVSASLGLGAEVETRRGSVGAEYSTGSGTRAQYQVILPGESREASEAEAVNPFDPTTIPVGATVMMDQQTYTTNGQSANLWHFATEDQYTEATGNAYSISRTDPNTVQVMIGPVEAIEASRGVGVDVAGVTAMLGRQDSLGYSSVQTAQFDLSSPQGQASYAQFIASGQIDGNAPGVSHAATVERLDYNSQTRLQLGLGPLQADLAGPENTGTTIKTTYPDGSTALTTELQYSGNVPLQVDQRFDASGEEILSERTYQFKIDGDLQFSGLDSWFVDEEGSERTMAGMLNIALTGETTGIGPVQPGQETTLTFTETQMQALMGNVESAAEAQGFGTNELGLLLDGREGPGAATTSEFAVSLARNLGGDPYNMSERMMSISSGADGDPTNDHYNAIDAHVGTDGPTPPPATPQQFIDGALPVELAPTGTTPTGTTPTEIVPTETAPRGAAPTELTPADERHADHRRYASICNGVCDLGIAADTSGGAPTENLSAALFFQSKQMDVWPDQVALSNPAPGRAAGETTFVVEHGTHPEQTRFAGVNTADAVVTPAVDSFKAAEELDRQRVREQPDAPAERVARADELATQSAPVRSM
jgi:hypothetical protein